MSAPNLTGHLDEIARNQLIRDIVERYPATMPVLDGYGIDTCCGGGLTPAAAAEAHGHDPEQLIGELVTAMRNGTG